MTDSLSLRAHPSFLRFWAGRLAGTGDTQNLVGGEVDRVAGAGAFGERAVVTDVAA